MENNEKKNNKKKKSKKNKNICRGKNQFVSSKPYSGNTNVTSVGNCLLLASQNVYILGRIF